MNGKRLMALGIVVTLSVCSAACGKNEEAAQAGKAVVEVENPRIGELTNDTTYIGTVEPQQQVAVIPKVSGTVTKTHFQVGDTVREGDVLFEIDDEAYQIQLASAQAAYNYAQAGVTASTGGARDLQNFQTEEQIRQLKKNLSDSYESIDDMEDSLDELREQGKTASAGVSSAQASVDSLSQTLGAQNAELTAAEEALKTAEEALTAAKEAADKDPDDTAAQAAFAAAQASANAAKAERDTAQAQVQATSAELAVAKQGLSTAQAAVNSIDSGKTQLKSGIDQLETSQSTIEDSISTAEQSYAITQNEIYPQTDATYAAQLEQAAVGIDSARLQLDYCKVTSPIGGVVEAVNVEADGMAAAGNAAYIISNKDSMTVTFGVTEAARDALNVGDHVTVDRNGATYDGIVTEIGTMAGVQTKLFEVKASVAGAGDALPSGVSVKVSATTEREEGKLLVPFDAIYFSGGDAYVYCVEDGMLVRTSVTVGLMDDTQAVIEEGLTEDSLVVGNWSSRLRNGAEAEIVSVNGESAEPSGTGDAQETESGSEETSDAQSGEGAEE